MKKIKTVLIAFFLFLFGTTMLKAQNLDRVAISSGGISSDTLDATIGEIFVFSLSSSGISLEAGSQSSQSNTGGILGNVSETKNSQSEILIYPNPVTDFLNLQINGLESENISFQVFDVAGKLVFNRNCIGINRVFKINVSELTGGNYFIKGYTSDGQSFGQIKFIKL